MSAKDFGLWALLAWLWGSSFLAIDIGLENYDPLALVAGRMIIGAAVLAAFIYAKGVGLKLGPRGWLLATVLGLTGNVIPFFLISYAEQIVDSGLAALIMGIAPIVTLALAPLVHFEETLGPGKILGAAFGFGGIIVLVGPSAAAGLGGDLLPQMALIGAALCYASTALISRRFAYPNPLQMAAASVLTGAVLITIVAAMSTPTFDLAEAPLPSSLAVLYLGLGPTALAALIYFHLIPRIGAARLQQVNYVVPVLGTFLGMAVLAEQPAWTTWTAIPLILLGVYFVSRPDKARNTPASLA